MFLVDLIKCVSTPILFCICEYIMCMIIYKFLSYKNEMKNNLFAKCSNFLISIFVFIFILSKNAREAKFKNKLELCKGVANDVVSDQSSINC